MGPVSSTNAALSNLIQTLTDEKSPLLASLSTPAAVAALKKASPEDIFKISDQALQLQLTDALFGGTNTTNSLDNSFFSQLEAIGSGGDSSSLANQLAAYQGSSQLDQTQALFGITPANSMNQTMFDVLA